MLTDRILLEAFITRHPIDAARLLESQMPDATVTLLEKLPIELLVKLFNNLDRQTACNCFSVIKPELAAKLIQNLPARVASIYLRQISDSRREKIFAFLEPEISRPLQRILDYSEGSATALADPFVLALTQDITAAEARKRLQKYHDKVLYYIYIVNQEHKLTGVMNIRELMSARPEKPVALLMRSDFISINAGSNFQAVLDHPGWQDHHTLPVTDDSGIFIGAIRYRTLRQIEKDSKKSLLPAQAVSAINALGELYQIGLTGLIRSATAPVENSSENKTK